ncbi:MAG: hypothetical protein OXT09_05415 [Myxococcales bacterium]|nr:hypothetical protein [Myxococcales bacterium]
MAGNQNTTPDQEATKWFRAAMVGTVLYVGVVFAFILSAKVGNEALEAERAAQEQSEEHGQPD